VFAELGLTDVVIEALAVGSALVGFPECAVPQPTDTSPTSSTVTIAEDLGLALPWDVAMARPSSADREPRSKPPAATIGTVWRARAARSH
jgi:hypothetical protein